MWKFPKKNGNDNKILWKFCLGFSASNLAALKNVNDTIIHGYKPGGTSNRKTSIFDEGKSFVFTGSVNSIAIHI